MTLRLQPGEIAAANWRPCALSAVVGLLLDVSRACRSEGRPAIVAIDGRGGAGKTSFAERLCELVPRSAVVHTDDIAWNQAYFDRESCWHAMRWSRFDQDGLCRAARRHGSVLRELVRSRSVGS